MWFYNAEFAEEYVGKKEERIENDDHEIECVIPIGKEAGFAPVEREKIEG